MPTYTGVTNQMLPAVPSQLLSLDQLADRLGMSRSQVFELTRERSQSRRAVRLPVIRIGKRKYVRAESFERWLRDMEQQSA